MNPLDIFTGKSIGHISYKLIRGQVWQKIAKMAKINNFDNANIDIVTVEKKNYPADKHSPIGGRNVENLHSNSIGFLQGT